MGFVDSASYEFNKNAIKDGIIKNGIIYGPNGSGKTNFSLALFDIENHLSPKWKKIDCYVNFVYAYSKNAGSILVSESLRVGDNLVFERKNGSFSIDKQQFPMEETIEKNLGSNANNVSVINFLLTSYPLGEEHYLIKLSKFVNSMLWFRNLDIREFIGLETFRTVAIRACFCAEFREYFPCFPVAGVVCGRVVLSFCMAAGGACSAAANRSPGCALTLLLALFIIILHYSLTNYR